MTEYYSSKGFPAQKLATSNKSKKWFRDCIDAAIGNITGLGSSTYRRTYFQKKVLRDLEFGLINLKDIDYPSSITPGLVGQSNLDELQMYPIQKPRIDLLVGESVKRRFDWTVRVVNEDSISEKEKMIKEYVTKALAATAMSQDYDEQKLQEELNKINRWVHYEAQDMRERMGSQILTHLYRELNLPIQFMHGFNDALNVGEEVYCVDVVAGEPVARHVDPLTVWTIRNGRSYKIEDSDIIIEDSYISIGKAIDEFYDYLTARDIEKLESQAPASSTEDTSLIKTNKTYPAFPSDLFADANTSTDIVKGIPSADTVMYGPFDSSGNVRRTRVVWKGLRKVGVLSFFDEQGMLQEKIVDENYKPSVYLGEKVKWIWISEWYEGTRLADDIYVKMQARPIQFRRMDNLSACGSGYVGTIYAQSLLEIMKPYIYLYAEIMAQLKKALKKFKAPKIELDVSKIPDDWTLSDWLYYAEEMGYLIVDSFKEGAKGAATGKLAGNFNTSGKSYSFNDMGGYIQQLQLILAFVERQVAIISGVSDQRLGQIDNRETVGGVERSVTQSSHITEKIFALHDNTKVRMLELLLETAKYAWRKSKSKKKQYVLDDLSTMILNIDGELFNESEYGVFVNNTTDDTELIASMKQLAHAMIQNDKLTIKDLMTILTTPSVSTMRRELERSESERQQAESQRAEAEQEAITQEMQMRAAIEEEKLALQERNNIRDNETRIIVATMGGIGEEETDDGRIDEMRLRLEEDKLRVNEKLAEKKLNETIRHNMATEKISKIKKPTSK